MKATTTTILALGLALLFAACGDRDHHGGAGDNHHDGNGMKQHHADGKHMQSRTKIVKIDGVQAAFDVMTAEHHGKMAKQMHIDWKPHTGMDHHVSVTLMDLAAKKVITDADVTITVNGPGGYTHSKKGDVMSAGGMHHHGLDFKMNGSGKYRVKAEFTRNGKAFAPEVELNM